MAFSTELVARADEYQTLSQSVTSASTTVTLPAGTWLCTLTATVQISSTLDKWIELDGTRATCQSVYDTSVFTPTADLGVVLASVAGGRAVTVKSDVSRTMQFHAARIG